MATPVLDEMQFEIDGYVFGLGKDIAIDAEGFDPGDPDKITQDGVNPINGARVFGRDMQGAGTWTFATFTGKAVDTASALAAAEAMSAVWRNEKWHPSTGIAMMRYRVGGRTRCVFGKPRRFSFKPGNAILGGFVPPLATFDLSDAKYYDETEQYVDLRLLPAVSGGFTVPFEAPLAVEVVEGEVPSWSMKVGGNTTTALVVDFIGPCTNPSVDIGSFHAGLVGTLPAGKTVTTDARPWAMSITKSAGVGSVSLDRRTMLSRALVGPGAYAAIFKGTDNTGTARARVRWRNANTSL